LTRPLSGHTIRGVELPQIVRERVEWMVDQLCSEFEGHFDRDQISTVVNDSAGRLATASTVSQNLPLLVHRFSRERLKAIRRLKEQGSSGTCDVVFVSLSGGGRGQIAAALTTKLSNEQVSVHAAGTAAFAEVDPGVRVVLGELGVNPDEPFVRPVTDEVIQGADVIVTMGHSVGEIDIPEGVRHEDWRVGDPLGAPIEEIRRVRTDIEHRVRSLLETLPVSVGAAGSAGSSPAESQPE
jgi:arsenate reductase (thioredoxin)